jgi:5-methylcytosine-specific restriction endonuclease McrA
MLNSKVLVLNKSYLAIQVVPLKHALSLFVRGRADAVLGDYTIYTFEDWLDLPDDPNADYIHTPMIKVRVPRVLRLTELDGVPKYAVKFSRKNIYLRDRNRCQYCGTVGETKDLNLDHILPSSRGGRTSWENVVCSCVPCNQVKENRTPKEAGMKLRRQPHKPDWRTLNRKIFQEGFQEEWKNFLDEAYWNVGIEST